VQQKDRDEKRQCGARNCLLLGGYDAADNQDDDRGARRGDL
jgi:hypothetical protein